MSNKALRPSPSDSATVYPVGYRMIGNDGNTWEVRANASGVQRWQRVNTINYTQPSFAAAKAGVDTNESTSFGSQDATTQSYIKPFNMSTQKSKPAQRKAQEIRTIETSLINKEEVFRMLALAESTGLPLLLVGQPGVAKTKTVIEYAKAWLNRDGKMTADDFANKIYILETDEGTKASEIKGIN